MYLQALNELKDKTARTTKTRDQCSMLCSAKRCFCPWPDSGLKTNAGLSSGENVEDVVYHWDEDRTERAQTMLCAFSPVQ